MKILLEYVFIENIILDYILLKETAWLSKQTIKREKAWLASFIGAMYIVVMLIFKLNVLNYAISKILLAFLIIYIAFSPKSVKLYLKLVLIFFIVSMINTGVMVVVMEIFNLRSLTTIAKLSLYTLNYVFTKFILLKLWKLYKDEITKRSLMYNVKLTVNGKSYMYKGFLDTGNTVYSHGMPIIFAGYSIENLKGVETFEVQTVTLGSISHKTAYVFDDVLIYSEQESWRVKAGVVFENNKISNNNYNMILNYTLFTDNLGGIKI